MHWVDNFIKQQQLPASFITLWEQCYQPLANALLDDIDEHQNSASSPFVLGINGCQGSGKSTLSELLRYFFNDKKLSTVVLSLDDFYLTWAERQQLAVDYHPLFASRGVPGTHDTEFLQRVLTELAKPQGRVRIPRFNKATDDRKPEHEWDEINLPVAVVIVEGWCLGVESPTFEVPSEDGGIIEDIQPLNALEREQDPQGLWRKTVNDYLANSYQIIWQQIDRWVMLAAPSFACVKHWRLEQEQKLIANSSEQTAGLMSEADIEQFVQHYQRLTERGLRTLPAKVDYLFSLDEERNVVNVRMPEGGKNG